MRRISRPAKELSASQEKISSIKSVDVDMNRIQSYFCAFKIIAEDNGKRQFQLLLPYSEITGSAASNALTSDSYSDGTIFESQPVTAQIRLKCLRGTSIRLLLTKTARIFCLY